MISNGHIYELRPMEGGGLRVFHRYANEYVLQLRDAEGGQGMTTVIFMTWTNLRTIDAKRADDYIAGVCIAVTHCIIAGVPVVGTLPKPD